jgi:hypothetical protein
MPQVVLAYFDPGNGSMLFQASSGGPATVALGVQVLKRRLVSRLGESVVAPCDAGPSAE